jgi:ubiquinol-cytochrome c reductase cytochrome c1 subunit
MKKLILSVLASLAMLSSAHAAVGGMPWDKFPVDKMNDVAALQHGAKLFVNHCLNCHSAAYMRYNRLRDIGLTEAQIRDNLLFATERVGDTMKVALTATDAKAWFGAQPPDLTVVARSRSAAGMGTGADYLYTYMRTFYRDDTKLTGWNNLAYPNIGMPHVLWDLQGQRRAVYADEPDPHDPSKTLHVFKGFEQITPGTMSVMEYDNAMADLVAYMSWMAEPMQQERVRLGVIVLIFLSIFTIIAWRLNAAFWKDIK